MTKRLTLVYGGMLEELAGEGRGLFAAAIEPARDAVGQAHRALGEKRA